MKQKRKISILIALAMMLTVFAIPSMAYGASYSIGPKGASEIPNYIPIGGTIDLDVKSKAAVNQSDWKWEVEKHSNELFEGDVSAIATIDENGVLTARGEGLVTVTATKKTVDSNTNDYDDDYYDYPSRSTTLGIGFLYNDNADSNIRFYPNKTAKLMNDSATSDNVINGTYVVPAKYVIDDPSWPGPSSEFVEKNWGTYTITAIAPDAVDSKNLKKIVVPDTVTSIGNYALGYDLTELSNPATGKMEKRHARVNGITIYGTSNNSAAARYAKANGFAYKNMNVKPVTVTSKPKKVANVKAKAGKKQMTVTWKQDKNAKGYQITYAQKKNFKKAKNVAITKNKTTKKVIKKLKAGKKYYVKVRAYKKAGNKKVYGAYSKVKTVKVK